MTIQSTDHPKRLVEGVTYYRYVVRYRRADRRYASGCPKPGKMVFWSPGFPWIYDEVARTLDERFDIQNIVPKSVSIEGPT